jgi:effector-binding domain-containing protein
MRSDGEFASRLQECHTFPRVFRVLAGTKRPLLVLLPIVKVASVVHRGSMQTVVPVYQALIRWIEDRGFHLVGRSRELYHEMGAEFSPRRRADA